MTGPLKVLHVLDGLGVGGAETWLMELLRHWSGSRTVQTDFLCTSGKPGIFDREAVSLGARIHYVRFGRKELPRFGAAFRRILEEGGYDALHDHCDCVSGWHFLLGIGALPKVRVTHVHNPAVHLTANYAVTPFRRSAVRFGRSLTLKLATHICGTSSKALTDYGFEERGRPPYVSVLHCGFAVTSSCQARDADRRSIRKEFEFPDDARIVLFAGRLDRDFELHHPRNHKNSWFAALIARQAVERDQRIRLLMAGAGDEQREELNRRIAAWGLSDQLRVIGLRRDIGRLMRASDVLLFPSADEGLGMAAVEAQAAGLPVVASTAVPAEAVIIPDLFTSLGTGEPLEQWICALESAMAKPRLPPAVCRAILEASTFSIGASAQRLEAIYRRPQ